MRIVVVVSDARQLVTAGVRIRYRRLEPHLEAAGHSLRIIGLDDFRGAAELAADVCLISKCYDARALIIAEVLQAAGVAVGVDMFDDYFSNRGDSRFVHLREWLRALAPNLSFAICSTARMSKTLEAVLPEIPAHIVNDPSDRFDPEAVASTVGRNVERALSTRRAQIAWFGIGDNPYFPVGLSDLHAFSSALSEVAAAGFEPRLSIVTNRRALEVERLEMVARLPFHTRIEEWTEPLEREVIAESLFCFLPVNAQPFSAVKSLNRAVTALVGGAQVLTAGFPLYDALRPYVYDAAGALIADVERGAPALRRETLSGFRTLLERSGDPQTEAVGLAAFLEANTKAMSGARDSSGAVVHGRRSSKAIHKFARRLGRLSVASPLNRQNLGCDVSFALLKEREEPVLVLSSAAAASLSPDLRDLLSPYEARGMKGFSSLPLTRVATTAQFDLADAIATPVSAVATMRYPAAMSYLRELLAELFGVASFHLSELESPFFAVRPEPERSVVVTSADAG